MFRRNAPRRSFMLHLAIAAALGLALVGLTQCRTVPDSVTGLEVQTGRLSGRSSCTHHCQREFLAGVFHEFDVHRDALRGCQGDVDCRNAEDLRHHGVIDGLIDDRQRCKKSCYNEGGGHGGEHGGD